MDIRIEQITQPDAQLQSLVSRLDELMMALYPPESNHLLPVEELFDDQTRVMGAYDEQNRLLACGAARLQGKEWGELKRLIVSPQARGIGLAAQIVEQLELYLKAENRKLLRLEVGVSQPEAIALYRKLGFREVPPFGEYRPDPLSLFMEKDILI